MVTKVKNPLLDMLTEDIDGINMAAAGSGIDMKGAAIKNLSAPADPNDAARLSDLSSVAFPVGIGPLPWPGSEGTVPTGWLLCNGQIYNIIDYPALHTILQNTYGGDNITTFGVPDLRSRIPLGKDNMGGFPLGLIPSATTEGGTGGSPTHTLTMGEMPSHSHTNTVDPAGSHTHTGSTAVDGAHVHPNGVLVYNGDQGTGGTNAARDQGNTGSTGSEHSHSLSINPVSDHIHTVTIDSMGGGGAHSILQPYLVVNYIIKAE